MSNQEPASIRNAHKSEILEAIGPAAGAGGMSGARVGDVVPPLILPDVDGAHGGARILPGPAAHPLLLGLVAKLP